MTPSTGPQGVERLPGLMTLEFAYASSFPTVVVLFYLLCAATVATLIPSIKEV